MMRTTLVLSRLHQGICGIDFFTFAAKLPLHIPRDLGPPARAEERHKIGKLHQVHNPEERAPLPHDDFRIRCSQVGPRWRDRAKRPVVDAQQETLAGSVIALANADKLPAAVWMEGMDYADKLP